MDILITTAPKDFNKLKFNYESIVRNIEGIDEVIYVSPVVIPSEYLPNKDVLCFTDAGVLDFDFFLINDAKRRGWYRQQFIKLFQELTLSNYLVVDSDVFICKPLEVSDTRPIFYLGKDQLHQPYFNLMKDLVNLDRVYPHSFISEIMYFKKDIIDEIVSYVGVDEYAFFYKCVSYINEANDPSGFSEYELYGNFTTKYFPGLYQYEHIKVLSKALKRKWTNEEIQQYITSNKDQGFDLLTMHSWI